MANRSILSPGDASCPLSSLLRDGDTVPHHDADYYTQVAERVAAAIAAGEAHVEHDFLRGAPLAQARAFCAKQTLLPLPPPLRTVVAAVEELRIALTTACGRALLPSAELTLLSYRAGGSYRRHCDDRPGISLGGASSVGVVRRSLSLLIYLTPDDWRPGVDGGELRVFHPRGSAPPLDVPPLPGTLVVFDSATVPHEVLVTRRERLVLAGWLQERTHGEAASA